MNTTFRRSNFCISGCDTSFFVRKFIPYLIIASVFVSAIPRAWTDGAIFVLNLSLENIVVCSMIGIIFGYYASCSRLIEVKFFTKIFIPLYLYCTFLYLVGPETVHYTSKFFITDSFRFFAIMSGWLITRIFNPIEGYRIFRRALFFMLPVFIYSMIAHSEELSQRYDLGRFYDPSDFASSFFICISFPLVMLLGYKKCNIKKDLFLSFVLIFLCAWFVYLSGTRSTALLLLVSFLLCLFGARDAKVYIVVAFIFLFMLYSFQYVDIFSGNLLMLSERASETNLAEESRFFEIESMLGQVGAIRSLFGAGLGSSFVSPIGMARGVPYTEVLHVGVANFIFKGGVPFLCVWLLGILRSLRIILSSSRLEQDRSYILPYAISFLSYSLLVLMSGGFSYFALFFMGIFMGYMYWRPDDTCLKKRRFRKDNI